MTPEQQGRERAEAFRLGHGLGVQPLPDLVALIEQTTDVDVAILQAGPDEHGMTMRDPLRAVTMIAVARTRNPMRQRSTLAHELAHVLFDDCSPPKPSGWSDRGPEEQRADSFARHLLVPIDGIRGVLTSREDLSEADLAGLVQRFQASPAIIAIQLNLAGYIDASRKQRWMALTAPALATRYGWADQYHALQSESDMHRAPQRLLARATTGYIESVVSLEAIARLRATTPEQVQADFDEAGITPSPTDTDLPWAAADDLPAGDNDFSDLDALDEPPGTS
ncbi:hypothetical protein N802_16480 [Knoellia sinensis KCTC 19936]|uniref:IrrE N-terminal-like domain-containing protein n=1 Tax=Knoellia sinensis KCTC 19936 TaxID=1385520 RepID=A0A0A0JBI5_9MICO|nr:ImmA/IrrE family metallo-endopeptidase [Knoellia sinensis]KGN32971.1 hypothetical protein N802_16480 [Knoellia sinensis KCTC 19936]